MKHVNKTISPELMEDLCQRLAELQVHRNHYIRATIRETNAVRSLVARALGFQWDLPEKQRGTINARAMKIVQTAFSGEEQTAANAPIATALRVPLEVAGMMCAPPDAQRAVIEKEMKRLAKLLPVWPWAEEIKGLSDLGLAIIVAEAGDINKYSTVGKLKKRFGLAPITKDGVTKACSTWRKLGGLSADDWKDQGSSGPKYKPRRRAAIFSQVGTQIIGGMGKGKRPLVGENVSQNNWSYYEKLFVERLRHEALKNPAHLRAVTEAGKESYSKHAAFMALRYVEQRLLKHLWQAWRRAVAGVYSNDRLPAVNSSAQAERSANGRLTPNAPMPSAPIPVQAGKRRARTELATTKGMPAANLSAQAECSASTSTIANVPLPSAPIPHAADEAAGRPVRTRLKSNQGMPDATPSTKAGNPAKRRAIEALPPNRLVPAATPSADEAERSASTNMITNEPLPSAPIQ